jgi:hypothetical protein
MVPKFLHEFVMGVRCKNLDELYINTRVHVSVPGSESSSEEITLRGPKSMLMLGMFTLNAAIDI